MYGIGDLRWTVVPEPSLKPGEVLVKVKACGICGSDVARVFKTGTYHFPTIIGHEFAGEVCKVFDSTTQSYWLNKRVGIFPLKPCFSCDNCRQGKYELCTDYDYLGSRCDGGFGEYVAVPSWNLIELPETVGYPTAAMLEPASVAMHALRIAELQKGDTVAVTGPGTIGMILCRMALLAGAGKVILIGRSQSKLSFAKEYGIKCTVNSEAEDAEKTILSLTDGKGVDIAVEGTGASAPMNLCLDITRASGTVVALGNPGEEMRMEKKSYWKILRRQLKLCGTWNSRFGTENDDWSKVLSLLAEGQLSLEPLITHRLPFDGLREGLEIMRDRGIYSNKVMLLNE